MNKTPDEIKKGLAVCATLDGDCENCPYDDGKQLTCVDRSRRDALAYIIQLESDNETLKGSLEMWKSVAFSPGAVEDMARENYRLTERLAQVERERDAMSYDMHQLQGALCAYCENLYRPAGSEKVSCKVFGDGYGAEDNSSLICGKFKWRGVCEENTKGDSNA